MRDLIRGYGRGLTAAFFLAVLAWGVLLIVAPQFAMLRASLVKPDRQLDSGIAAQLEQDAATCLLILERTAAADAATAPTAPGGFAIPSPSVTAPPAGGLSIPTIGGGTAAGQIRPYILQCDRATTQQRLFRSEDEEPAFLHELYGAPLIAVDDAVDLDTQIAQAREVGAIAARLVIDIRAIEATASPYGAANFEALTLARLIPLSDESKEIERAKPINQIQALLGLRFERDGEIYVRLGLVTLFMTLLYAVCATALALVVCYPIAYNLSLASGPRKAAWLLLALLVPYAIVELMRVYAWLSIIENGGLINGVLAMVGAIDPAEPIEFKRSPITVFVVLVYTYILFMMFPLVNVMSTLDKSQIEAARDLGASTARIHRRVIIPHAKPGIAVGCIATFMLCAGAFSVPRIISRGLQGQWYSQTIYDKFFESGAVNVGAAYAFSFTVVCFALVFAFMYAMRARLSDFVRA